MDTSLFPPHHSPTFVDVQTPIDAEHFGQGGNCFVCREPMIDSGVVLPACRVGRSNRLCHQQCLHCL